MFAPSLLGNASQALKFVEGNAQDLKFPDNNFDVYTITFGLRNVTDAGPGITRSTSCLETRRTVFVLGIFKTAFTNISTSL